jgi:hypothetical protein
MDIVPSRSGFARVARGFNCSAEGKIMQSNIAQIFSRRQRIDDTAGPDMADQAGGGTGDEPAQGGIHTAATGKA